MPVIKILPHPEYCPQGAEVKAPAGTSICEALLDNGIDIEHACDMSCACTTCHVVVRKGFDSLKHVEWTQESPFHQFDNIVAVASVPEECYPDFTADGVLDLFDFLAYVNAFNDGQQAADCDGDGDLTLFDFLCYTNAFNAGC